MNDSNIDSYSFNESKDTLNINEPINLSINKNLIDRIDKIEGSLINITDEKLTPQEYIYNIPEPKDLVNINNTENVPSREDLINRIEKMEHDFKKIIDEKQRSKEHVYNVNSVNESNIPINPKTYSTVKKQVSINSEFKSPGSVLSTSNNCGVNTNASRVCEKIPTSTNFIVELPETINNVISLEIVHSEIPSVIYTFSEKKGNNEFIISLSSNDLVEDIEYTILIPDGIWFANDLQTFLSDFYHDIEYETSIKNKYLRYLKFDIPGTSAKPLFRFKTSAEVDEFVNIYGWSDLLYSDIADLELTFSIYNTNKPVFCINNEKPFYIDSQNEISFSLSCLGTIGFTLGDIYDNASNNYRHISFNDADYIKNIGIYTYYGFLEANNIYGHTNESGLFISVNDFVGNQSQQILLLGFAGTLTSDNILARVQVKSGPFVSNINNSNTDYNIKRAYHGGVRIRKLHIQILDTYGRIIDLQNYPTNFVFEFTCEYSNEKQNAFRNTLFP